jgi:hypothetical protein
MKSENNYNKLNALIYELIIFFERFLPNLSRNPWIRQMKLNCRDDWATFRTIVTMMELEEEIENIHQIWKKEEEQKNRPIYTELPADGSNAQQLLGGEMRLSAPWTVEISDKTEPSSSHEHN